MSCCRCGEMADAQDLKSWGRKKPCGFESHHRHQSSNEFSAQLRQRFAQPDEVGSVSEDGEVRVAAKLGCAVEYARLSAHEQGANAVRAHRRKDFAYRVRDQVSLQGPSTFARVSRSPANVAR